jgi:hypothetical protein
MKTNIKMCVLLLSLVIVSGTGVFLKANPTEVLPTPHPFYDAKILDKAFEDGKIGSNEVAGVLKVLSKYVKNDELKTLHETFVEQILKGKLLKASDTDRFEYLIKQENEPGQNAFLESFLKALKKNLSDRIQPDSALLGEKREDLLSNETLEIAEAETVTPALKGFLSPVVIADALGSFIAKRFKEELTIAYLEKFKKILKDNQDRGWTLLVPTTFTFLQNTDPFNFKVFMSTLKQSFNNDLNNLDVNLKNFLVKYKEKVAGYIVDLLFTSKGVYSDNFNPRLKDLLSNLDSNVESGIKTIEEKIGTLSGEELEKKWKELKPERIKIIQKLNLDLWNDDYDCLPVIFTDEVKAQENLKQQSEGRIERLKKEIGDASRENANNLSDELGTEKEKLKEINKKIFRLKLVWIPLKNKNILNLSIIFLDLIGDVKNGKHLAEIIDTISDSDEIKQMDHRFSSPVRLLALISRNLRKGDGWLELKDLKTLTQAGKSNLRNLFAGLIYAREVKETQEIIIDGKPLKQIIDDEQDRFDLINMYIEKTHVYMRKIRSISKKIKEKIDDIKAIKKAGKKLEYEEFHAYLSKVFELVEVGIEISELTGKKTIEETITRYLGCGRRLLEISKNIHDKAYGTALVNSVTILKEVLPEGVVKDEIVKYGTFMVGIASARDAKEMEKVLEAAALPVGSYRIIRANRFTVTLNTYPGLFAGAEHLNTSEEFEGRKMGGTLAFTAPVGIAFSWGKTDKTKNPVQLGPSNTIFLSAIDIGAVVSLRLFDKNSGLPEFTWKNILAPGLFWMHGFKNSPISIGLGVQYGPQLRELKPLETDPGAFARAAAGTPPDPTDPGDNTELEPVIKSSAFRFGLVIAVDLPIFNIFTKKEK